MSNNPKCWHYDEIDSKSKANCPNCNHWNRHGKRCKDHKILIKGPSVRKDGGESGMCTVGEVLRYKQPEVYQELAKIKKVTKPVKQKKVKINEREAEQLMKHDGYERRRGGIRQTRHS